jgi:hypothetical protein
MFFLILRFHKNTQVMNTLHWANYISTIKNQIMPFTSITNVDSICFHNVVSRYHQQHKAFV